MRPHKCHVCFPKMIPQVADVFIIVKTAAILCDSRHKYAYQPLVGYRDTDTWKGKLKWLTK